MLDSDFRDAPQSSAPVPPPPPMKLAKGNERDSSAVEKAPEAAARAPTAAAGGMGPANGVGPSRSLADVLLLLEGATERLVRLEAEVAAAAQQKKRDKPRLALLTAEMTKLQLLVEAWFQEVETLQRQ